LNKSNNGLLKKWNGILAAAGLSVWEGSDHRLINIESGSTTLDNLAIASRAARRVGSVGEDNRSRAYSFVKIGGAGDSETALFLATALHVLSERERKFLKHYQEQTVSEVASIYSCTEHAIYCRLNRIRMKLSHVADQLMNRN
jgi:DNA-directed RNA polymerase specialized sigma24 family protein